jgi:autotransporter-associated beta strand protein
MKSKIRTAIVIFVIGASRLIFAGSATWNLNPVSDDWNTPANWTPATVPNGPNDVATFGASTVTDVFISSDTSVKRVVYSAGSNSFTITAMAGTSLTLVGAGVENDSGVIQTLVADGGTNIGDAGGLVEFQNTSTADSATIIANSGPSKGIAGGEIRFSDTAKGGTARIEVFGTGELTLREASQGYVEVGSIEGDGQISLGDDGLAVGTNSHDCIFSGTILDGTNFTPLTKIGAGTLTLSGDNHYSGLTLILQGTLLVTSRTGSGTGSSGIQLNHGTFGGSGRTNDGVSVIALPGHAFISPGKDDHIGTLTCGGLGIGFNKGGVLKIKIDSASVVADKVVALNATLPGGRLLLVDEGGIALPAGTTFTVIDTSNAVIGTLVNLPDGGTITAGPNTYQANYQGGSDGRDLTLTVQ